LVTTDKDFGEKVYRERQPHRGVVLLRLDSDRAADRIAAMQRLLATHSSDIEHRFTVVTEKRVRLARK
jgi:hypothetical protein